LSSYFFGDFLAFLNQAHLFKDKTTQYTQFTKGSQLIHDFYCKYFRNETTNLASDLRLLLEGMSKTATHHQMFLICLRLLATPFGKCAFVGLSELQVIDLVFHQNFTDLYFSNRYLCKKFLLQLLANYLIQPDESFDWRLLFKLLGYMHLEFFSTRTVFVD
jgi:hypothetical protein